MSFGKNIWTLMAASALMLPAMATAASVTYDWTTTPATTTIGSQQTDWQAGQSIYLPQFNSSLGTLTAAQLSLTGDLSGSILVQNLDETSATITSTLTADIIASFGSGCTLSCSVTVSPLIQHVDPLTSGAGNSEDPGSVAFYGENSTSATTTGASLSQQVLLDALTGTGTVGIAVSATGHSIATGTGNIYSELTTYAAARASITYTYDVAVVGTPEPSTWMMLGTVLTALGLARGRRSFAK